MWVDKCFSWKRDLFYCLLRELHDKVGFIYCTITGTFGDKRKSVIMGQFTDSPSSETAFALGICISLCHFMVTGSAMEYAAV